jgi:hypothetical protein
MLTVQANTIVDDKHTLAKAQAEIQRLKGLLSRALKQVESHEDGGEKVGFAKLMAENEKLKQENKSLRIALAQFQQQQSTSRRNQSGGKRFSALGVLLEEDDLELSGEDYSHHKSEAGSQLSRHQSNSKKKHTGTRNLHRASAEANSSSADNAYTTHHSSSSSLDRSSDSSGHRSLKAASSSLHSLVTFSYFDQPQNKGTSSQSGEILFQVALCLVRLHLCCNQLLRQNRRGTMPQQGVNGSARSLSLPCHWTAQATHSSRGSKVSCAKRSSCRSKCTAR